MNNQIMHLIIFLACLAFVTVVILTGHDSSPLVQHLLAGAVGGAGAASGTNALPLLIKFFQGPQDPTATAPVTKQGGYIRAPLLVSLLVLACASAALSACATFQQAVSTHPVATGCASASAAIKTLTQARRAGFLYGPSAIAVDDAIATIAPICTAPQEASATAASVQALTSAVGVLEKAAAQYAVK